MTGQNAVISNILPGHQCPPLEKIKLEGPRSTACAQLCVISA